MENKIKNNIDKPTQLEKLYHADKKNFAKAFHNIYPQISNYKIAKFWKARLEFDNQKEIKVKIGRNAILFLILSCLITGFLIKLPQILDIGLDNSFFYEKNAGLIVFLGLSTFLFLTKEMVSIKHITVFILVFVVSAIYINLLPSDSNSDSIFLAYLHLPLMLWCLYGLIYIDFKTKDILKRIDYIKYNGDLAILYAVIAIVGGILTAVTLGLFSAINMNIETLYFDYIVIVGIVCAPIVATYILKNYPFVKNKIAPIIAKIFNPLVLITLVIYLFSILLTGKDPYNDRNFLIVFNLLLLGVMAIIVFSVSETSINKRQKFNEMTLFALSIITLVVDLIALSAIIYRLGEFGFTPNRTAVLGSNLLIFGNLVLVMLELFKVNFKGKEIKQVEMLIAKYLPIYAIWTIIVVFGFPLIFRLK